MAMAMAMASGQFGVDGKKGAVRGRVLVWMTSKGRVASWKQITAMAALGCKGARRTAKALGGVPAAIPTAGCRPAGNGARASPISQRAARSLPQPHPASSAVKNTNTSTRTLALHAGCWQRAEQSSCQAGPPQEPEEPGADEGFRGPMLERASPSTRRQRQRPGHRGRGHERVLGVQRKVPVQRSRAQQRQRRSPLEVRMYLCRVGGAALPLLRTRSCTVMGCQTVECYNRRPRLRADHWLAEVGGRVLA